MDLHKYEDVIEIHNNFLKYYETEFDKNEALKQDVIGMLSGIYLSALYNTQKFDEFEES